MPPTQLETPLADLATQSAAQPFDCLVVGGGSAGLTAARTLAERRLRVAVLEAGSAPFLTHIFNTELRFNRQLSDNVRNQTQYSPRLATGGNFGTNFSCLGGRGLFWNGSCPRYRAHDFNGWPFSLADLVPYYEWAENEFRVHNVFGESPLAQQMIADLAQAGFPAGPGPFAADVQSLAPGTLSAGVASGLGLFLRGAGRFISDGSLRVAVGVRTDRILINSGKATGVVATQRGNGLQKEVLSRAVILAGGGVESIRVAAMSGLPDDNGRLGKGIQDHIFYRSFHEGPDRYDPQEPQVAAVYIPASSQTTHQWEIHAPGRRFFSIDDGTQWNPAPGEAYWFMVRSFAPTSKTDSNLVEAREGDLGSAIVHFTHSEQDRERMDAMKAGSQAIARSLGLTIQQETIADPGASYHEAGGLDLGTDPATSVTRGDGGFHRVPNLVCVDAAAFPQIGAVNPHLTIVAVSRRQSGLLGDRLAQT